MKQLSNSTEGYTLHRWYNGTTDVRNRIFKLIVDLLIKRDTLSRNGFRQLDIPISIRNVIFAQCFRSCHPQFLSALKMEPMTLAISPCFPEKIRDLLISLKANNQLGTFLENETCDSKFEIEFTSRHEGKIYCGLSSFDLKFSDSSVLVSQLNHFSSCLTTAANYGSSQNLHHFSCSSV